MFSNKHFEGDSLIIVTNARLEIRNAFLNQNGYYDNIINLQSSKLFIRSTYNEISSNHARHILKASYIFISYRVTVNISHNVVYKVIEQVSTFERYDICLLQIYRSIYNSNQKSFKVDGIKCALLLSNNLEMISKSLTTETISYVSNNCKWLEGTVFQKANVNANLVYHKVIIKSNNTFVNKTSKRLVPLSVCPCSNNSSYNCYMANLYEVYPGQLLYINLSVSKVLVLCLDHHIVNYVQTFICY